jgi:PAS domain S-box-containing protein
MAARRLLLVDPDPRALKNLRIIFETEGYTALCVNDGKEALEVLRSRKDVDLVVSDLMMPNVDGYTLSYKIRTNATLKTLPVIIYSGTSLSANEEDIARKLGADIVIRKPASRQLLLDSVGKLLSEPPQARRNGITRADAFDLFQEYNSVLIEKLEQRNKALEEVKAGLEKQVTERTRRLDEANQSLYAANEELQAANKELISMNDQLLYAHDKIKEQSQLILEQHQAALQQSQQTLELILVNTRDEIIVGDSEGVVVFFNQAVANAAKHSSGSVIAKGMFVWDITVPERRETAKKLYRRALRGEVIELEASIQTTNGNKTYHIRYSPVEREKVITHVTIISVDVTEKKWHEDMLKKSVANLRAIFHNTVDNFTLLDTDLNIVAFNKNTARFVREFAGITMSEGQPILEIIPERRRKSFTEVIKNVNKEGLARVVTRYRAGQKEKWFEETITVVKEANKIIGYCVTAHDTTELKMADLEITRLNKSLLEFQRAIHTSSIVSIADAKGIITYVNSNFVAISGYSVEELIGQNHRVVSSGYHSREFWKNMWATIASGKIWRDRVKNRAKNGSYYWVDTFVMPFKDEKGNITEYLSIRNDITNHKLAEEELAHKGTLLEHAAKIARMGYWLRAAKSDKITVSPEFLALFEVTEREFREDEKCILRNIHPNDLNKIPFFIEDRDVLRQSADIEFRIRKGDGSVRWIHSKANITGALDNLAQIIGIIQDVTERKVIEEVLREYNERFELLSQATQDAIWDLDIVLNVVTWNHGVTDLFGYGERDVSYRAEWWQDKIHPEDRARALEEFSNAILNHRTAWTSQFRFMSAGGTYRHVYNRSYILYENGNAVRAIGSLQDVSARVEAVEEIEKLSLVASRTKNAVMITDRDGHIEWVNQSFIMLTGYTADEIRGQKSNFLQGPETDPDTVARISEKLKNQEFISEEIINYTKSGNKIWVKLDISPVFEEDGSLKNFISIQTDITELKEFENSITSIARELSNLIENANVPIFGINNYGKINEWNGVAASLMEYSKFEALGKKWTSILQAPDSNETFQHIITDVVAGGTAANIEFPLVTKSGRKQIILMSGSPRRNADNVITGAIFVGQNITELSEYRHNLERIVDERTRDLHVALEKEKEAVKLKNQFVSIASHEFRTPLTTINIAADFIRKYKAKLVPDAIDEKLFSIQKQVNNMTYLLDDILMIGKTEAGKMPVNLKPIEISPLIRNLCSEVEKAFKNSHVIHIEEKLAYREITSDEKLLRNIFLNLLTNAVKFSPGANSVLVQVFTVNEDLHLIVKDYGIGIPEEDLKNLFEPFRRGTNVESIQGTGLGMSIIKKAVELLNGKIGFKSSSETGTEITVILPI